MDHHHLVSGVVALVRSTPGWPTILGDPPLRFDIEAIDRRVPLPGGGSRRPDVIVTSRALNQSLVLECKTGSVKAEQLKDMLSLRDRDWVERGLVGPAHPSQHFVDLMIVCTQDNLDQVVRDIDAAGLPVPVLCFYRDRVSLLQGRETRRLETNRVLSSGAPARLDQMPANWMPFTDDSPQSEIAWSVSQAMLALWRRKRRVFNDSQVGAEAHPLWKAFPPDRRNHFRRIISELIDDGIRHELGGLIRVVDRSKSRQVWEMNPPGTGPAAETLRTRKWQSALTGWVERLRRGTQPRLPL